MNNYAYYYTYDLPVEYKNLKIYPATMKDYLYFHGIVDSLVIDKNSVPSTDINEAMKIIQMSYLGYLIHSHTEENKLLYKIGAILQMVLRDDELEVRYGKDENNHPIIVIKDEFYDSSDFDEIRRIICEYNEIDMIDENISKEVRDKIKEAENLRARVNGNKMASLEDQLVAVMITTSLSLEQIKELSIRKFAKILERVDHKLHYEIYLSASMSGLVTFKDKSFIKHWLTDLTRDKLKDNSISVESLNSKITGGQ